MKYYLIVSYIFGLGVVVASPACENNWQRLGMFLVWLLSPIMIIYSLGHSYSTWLHNGR